MNESCCTMNAVEVISTPPLAVPLETTEPSLALALNEWRSDLGNDNVSVDAATLAALGEATFATNETILAEPKAHSREDVQAAVKTADRHGIKLYTVSCGKNWGLGASGGQPGDKTSKLKTNPKMEIKGQESNSGDIDVETISSEEQSQEAVREYSKQVQKYEQLTESVLSSEPIPLGHRQTIRRYFEMIRPQGAETDAVFQESSE